MDDSELSFKFPELEISDTDDGDHQTLRKIDEYLDQEMEEQLRLLGRLREFEKRLDAAL